MAPVNHLWLACCLSVLSLRGLPAVAADDPANSAGRAELEKAVQSLRPHPSTDTTPVEFSVGGVRYRIPRNYIITMDNWSGGPQGLVTLQVNLIDMEPLTPANADCLLARSTERPPRCEPFKFWIEGTGGVSAEQAFNNSMHIYRNKAPIAGPSEYSKYEIGPENARIEDYRKVVDGRTLLYSCQIFDNRGTRDGICHPVSDRMPAGGTIQFFFRLSQLPEIEGIDHRFRRLVESFTIAGGKADGISHAQPSDAGHDQRSTQPGTGDK